jgi:hypothetical protein
VGVGVQRSGTKWWFDVLSDHPEVHRVDGTPRELHYFGPFSDRTLDTHEIAHYHQWFPRPPAGGVTGEWTPAYVYEPWSIPLLTRAAPDARILLLLRDPIARFRSGVKLQLLLGSSHSAAVTDSFHRGLYAGQVARLLEHVPRDRVLVLTYEQVRAEPEASRRQSAEHVGLDPARFPSSIEVREPRQRADDEASLSDLERELAARYRDDIALLARLLPELDLGRWPTAAS